MINIIGWTGNIFFLFGAIFLAKKWILGWHCQILGNACYLVYAVLLGFKEGMSLCALSILLIIVNIYGLKKWRNPQWIRMVKN